MLKVTLEDEAFPLGDKLPSPGVAFCSKLGSRDSVTFGEPTFGLPAPPSFNRFFPLLPLIIFGDDPPLGLTWVLNGFRPFEESS